MDLLFLLEPDGFVLKEGQAPRCDAVFWIFKQPLAEINIHDTGNWRCSATSAKCQHGAAKTTYTIQTMPDYKAPCKDLKGTPSERRSSLTILDRSQALCFFLPALASSNAPKRHFNVFVTFCKFWTKIQRIFQRKHRFWMISKDFARFCEFFVSDFFRTFDTLCRKLHKFLSNSCKKTSVFFVLGPASIYSDLTRLLLVLSFFN